MPLAKDIISIGSIDLLGDSYKSIVREITEEMEAVYDLVYNTLLATFTEPLPVEDLREFLKEIDAGALLQLIKKDPVAARKTLQAMRRLKIGVTA